MTAKYSKEFLLNAEPIIQDHVRAHMAKVTASIMEGSFLPEGIHTSASTNCTATEMSARIFDLARELGLQQKQSMFREYMDSLDIGGAAGMIAPSLVQVKTHRRSRVNKKWRKRYGMKVVPLRLIPYTKIYDMGVVNRSLIKSCMT